VRVFVAGASGAVGRPLVRRLVEGGHEVTGMTRREERAEALRADGANAVVADVFDEPRVREAIAAAGPEAVVHQLTALPERMNFRKRDLFEPTNRVRTEGTRILIDAARAAGARRFVAQGIAFAYRPGGERVTSEDAPLMGREVPGAFGGAMVSIAELERAVLDAPGMDGLVLRYGWFYGPGTHYGEGGSLWSDVRRRRFPVIGSGAGVYSFIHVDDAASATVAALEGRPQGVYNVTDDDPAPMSEWLPAYAEAIGARPPRRVPVWVARLMAGKAIASMAETLPGASNARARRELGWQPRWSSWREGFRDAPR
jgi:nucleoside-diphosphate-sugar epimerase